MYIFIVLALIFLAVNLPSYVRKNLMQQIADKSKV